MGKRGPKRTQAPPTTIRIDPELKDQIERAARASFRTPAEEIRARLKASFESYHFDDPMTHGLAALMADALDDTIRSHTGHPWHEHKHSWGKAKEAIEHLFKWFMPDGDDKVADDHPLLLQMRTQGLPVEAIAKMKRDLNASDLGKMAADFAIVRCEAAAEQPDSRFSERFGPIASVVERHLKTYGDNGAALQNVRRKGLAFFSQGETRRINASLPPEAYLPPTPKPAPHDAKGDDDDQ